MVSSLLTPGQEQLLREERERLRALQQLLAKAGATAGDVEALERSLQQLDRLFLLVIVGEFNSGKSTFINALLGQRLLQEGVTPTTTRIHRIGYGAGVERKTGDDGIEEVSAPVELLRHLQIVDTPGTNALDRSHEALTEKFVPRSDLVLFVTSADRPLTESERTFIEKIREWGKKLVLVINKIDFLTTDADRREVESFVRDNARQILALEPEVFPISAAQALAAKTGGADETDEPFARLESFLTETLDESERLRLKLLNPLGVGARLADQQANAVEARLSLLADDFSALEEIDSQLKLYGEDIRSEARFRLADVDNELHAFEKRGNEFFDDTLRLARAFDLMNKERTKADFERKVIADTPQQIEGKVNEIIDWLVGAELKQWQAVSRRLEERRQERPQRPLGELGEFDYNRDQLLSTVGGAARRAIQGFDQRAEATRLADSVQTAVAGTALVEVGAISLGTIFTILATTQVADITGILAASTLAVVGLFILPARRRKAKSELAKKILKLRTDLMDSLTGALDRESERSAQRIREAVSPYTRFVRGEKERLSELRTELDNTKSALATLKAKIEEL